MKCPKCKEEIKTKKCPKCDSKKKDELIDIYLGKLKEKVDKDSFSYPCIFGPIYALYYNFWELGFPWILIEGILLYFIPLKFSIIIVTTLNVIIGFIFHEWYLKKANNEIEKIKNNEKIKDKKIEIEKRSKPSIFMLTSTIIIYLLFALLLSIKTSQIKKLSALWIIIPTDFSEEISYGPYQGYIYSTEKDQCYIDITSFEPGSQTPENYINSQTHEDNAEISGLETEVINSKKWYKVEEITKEGMKKYTYATKEKERIYSVKYIIYKDSGVCSRNKEALIKSMRF